MYMLLLFSWIYVLVMIFQYFKIFTITIRFKKTQHTKNNIKNHKKNEYNSSEEEDEEEGEDNYEKDSEEESEEEDEDNNENYEKDSDEEEEDDNYEKDSDEESDDDSYVFPKRDVFPYYHNSTCKRNFLQPYRQPPKTRDFNQPPSLGKSKYRQITPPEDRPSGLPKDRFTQQKDRQSLPKDRPGGLSDNRRACPFTSKQIEQEIVRRRINNILAELRRK